MYNICYFHPLLTKHELVTNFSKNPQYKILQNCVQWEQTGRHYGSDSHFLLLVANTIKDEKAHNAF
jgi:hypothetical protein